jgi:hypothetical protein
MKYFIKYKFSHKVTLKFFSTVLPNQLKAIFFSIHTDIKKVRYGIKDAPFEFHMNIIAAF